MPSNYALTSWGQPTTRDHTVPSGQVCKIRDLGIEDMAELGIVEQMDTLGMLVQNEHINRAAGKKPQDRAKKKPTKAQAAAAEQDSVMGMMRDPQKFKAIGIMLDKVAVACVLEPVLENPYITEDGKERKLREDERLEDAIYADHISFSDKMDIFSEVFKGVGDMENFRSGSGSDVADVEDVAKSGQDS